MKTHSLDGNTNRMSKLIYWALSNRTATSHFLLNKSRHTSSPPLKYKETFIVIYPWHAPCAGKESSFVVITKLGGINQSIYTLLQCSYCSVVSFNCVFPHAEDRVRWTVKLGSCPHLLHCHHACCVDVTTTPASLLSLYSPFPPNATVRTPHPLDSQRWTHPVHELTTNQKPFLYANDTHFLRLNMANCYFSKLWMIIIKNTTHM